MSFNNNDAFLVTVAFHTNKFLLTFVTSVNKPPHLRIKEMAPNSNLAHIMSNN